MAEGRFVQHGSYWCETCVRIPGWWRQLEKGKLFGEYIREVCNAAVIWVIKQLCVHVNDGEIFDSHIWYCSGGGEGQILYSPPGFHLSENSGTWRNLTKCSSSREGSENGAVVTVAVSYYSCCLYFVVGQRKFPGFGQTGTVVTLAVS